MRARGVSAIDLVRGSAAADDAIEAVSLVLAGQITIAQAARESGYGQALLDRLAWNAAKTATFIRDGWSCVRCHRKADDAQHRVARGMGGTANPVIAYGLVNLIAMCRPCHDLAESRDRDMRVHGYWLYRKEDPALKPVTIARFGAAVWLTASGDFSFTDPRTEAAA